MSNYKKLEDLGDPKDIFEEIITALPLETSRETTIQVIERLAEYHRTNSDKLRSDDPSEKPNFEQMTNPQRLENEQHNTFCSFDWCGSLLSYFKVT